MCVVQNIISYSEKFKCLLDGVKNFLCSVFIKNVKKTNSDTESERYFFFDANSGRLVSLYTDNIFPLFLENIIEMR